MFSLLNKQTKDWDKKRYGQAAIFSSDKKHILLSIGKPRSKEFLLPYIKKLAQKPEFVFYATGKTHEFLRKHAIKSSLVYKISQIGQNPNIADLLRRRIFDIIINIPTREKVRESKEFTDGKLIRKGAIEMGIHLITDLEVAGIFIQGLAK